MEFSKILILTESQINTAPLAAIFDEKQIKHEEVCLQNGTQSVETCVNNEFDGLIYFGRTAENVEKAFEAAKICRYRKAVLVSSALSYFDRASDNKLSEKHAFIKNSNLCEAAALKANDGLNVSVLETPFLENRFPADFPICNGNVGFDCKKFILAPFGGSATITAEGAAKGVFAVLMNGDNGVIYPLSDENRKYKEILKAKTVASKPVYEFPEEFSQIVAFFKKLKYKKKKKTAEFDFKYLYDGLLHENLYFNADEVKKQLKYEELGL